MECEKCLEIDKWFHDNYPDRKGYGLCEAYGMCELCYEKSKEHTVYTNFPYKPEQLSYEQRIKYLGKAETIHLEKIAGEFLPYWKR